MTLPFKIDIENLPHIDDRRGRHKTLENYPTIFGIYKITSLKGAIYIGLSNDIYYRIYTCYKKMRCKQQSKIYNSLKKYGVESHTFEIIHIVNTTNLNKNEIRAELNYLESKYISQFNSFYGNNDSFGLNLTKGGDSMELTDETRELIRLKNIGKKVSEENKKKTSERFKGKTLTKEHKDKISKSKTGQKYSDEARKNMSNAQKGKKHTEERKSKRVKLKQSAETIEKRASKIRGDNHWTKGKGHTKETKEKISKTLTGKYVGEKSASFGKKMPIEQKEKISKSKKGTKRSEDSKKKQGESIKGEKHHTYGKTISEDTRKKLRDSHIGIKPTEETLKKRSESLKATWAKKKAEGKPWKSKK